MILKVKYMSIPSKEEVLALIDKSLSLRELEDLRVSYLGKSGLLTSAMSNIANLSLEEKKTFGASLNKLKQDISLAIEQRKAILEQEEIEAKLKSEKLDVTQPIRPGRVGKIHPVTQATQEIINIFASFEIFTFLHLFDQVNQFEIKQTSRHRRVKNSFNFFYYLFIEL